MAGECGSVGSSTVRDRSVPEESACASPHPSEDREAARISQDRAAEQKREDFYARVDPGVTGETARKNTCDVLRTPALTPDWDAQKKASVRTAAIDRPLQKDPLGNALIAALAGGALAGVEAAVAAAGRAPAAALALAVAKGAVKDFAKDVALDAAVDLVSRSGGPDDRVTRPASPMRRWSSGSLSTMRT